ncbi:hypothetical protein DZK25_00685 [Wenzhouxiangella sp. 15181]|nr:hypothetical protein DZK25_00685 [Wenzhouxiangella sp. 15181]RFP68199.1 hypothetical protein DZK26_09385 [Wenzhouxiangella sp. 15190]
MVLALTLSLAGCGGDGSQQEQEASAPAEAGETQQDTVEADAEEAAPETDSDPDASDERVIEVVVRDFAIDAPEEMGTGWYTMRLENLGQQTHFVIMYRLVEGKTIEDQRREVVPAFDELMAGIRSGEIEKADIGTFLGENIPEWGLQMTYVGGVGLLAPGRSAQTSFRVPEPGTYLMECYVKSPDGTFHTSMGMLTQVDVVDQGGEGAEPEADATIAITNDGIEAPDTLPSGSQTIRVDIEDRPETFMPYDVNLARLEEDSDLEDIVSWMDWSDVGGLRAPAPVEFLGGVEHMEAGNHGYMTVDLSPGRYLWISEINAAEMHQVFTVE